MVALKLFILVKTMGCLCGECEEQVLTNNLNIFFPKNFFIGQNEVTWYS